jgi:hypothetical protein
MANTDMIFLIEYDRRGGKLIEMRTFSNDERDRASAARLELELRLNRALVDHELVTLEAQSEDALHQTHQRYFDDVETIGRAMIAAAERLGKC